MQNAAWLLIIPYQDLTLNHLDWFVATINSLDVTSYIMDLLSYHHNWWSRIGALDLE
jgi:hypothetical protein